MKNTKIIGYISAITSTILMGSMGIFVRNISTDGYIITFARLGLSLFFLILYLVAKREIGKIKQTNFSFYLPLTGALMSVSILCYINAIKNTSLATAVFLLYLAPIIASGLATIIVREKLTYLNFILLCMAFIGFLFLLEFKFSLNINELKGYIWGIFSAICYALYLVFNRKTPEKIPVLVRSFYQFLFGAIVMLPFLDFSVINGLTARNLYWLLSVGLFQGFFALSLLITAIKYLKTVEYGTISYLEPLVASLIGFLLYSEKLTLLQFIGCTIVFFAGIIQIISTKNNKIAG